MKRGFLLALLAVAPLAACAVMNDDAPGSQEADHTAGEPTYAQNSWLWADETADEFRESARLNPMTMDPVEFLALEHPMTQRLQFWMDRLDEALRAAYPEKLAGVPHPQAMLQKTATVNAWVSCLPVTWNVPVRLEGAAPDGAAPSASRIMLLQSGHLYAEGMAPLDRAHDDAKLDELTKFVNGGYAKCRAKVEEGVVVFGEGCIPAEATMARTAPKLQFCATGKYITFTTSYLLASLDEDRIIATMAHEMGHFYRSHVNMPSDVVNYFYALEETHAHKPSPDARTLEQTANVRAKLRGELPITDWNEEDALMKERHLGFYTTEQEADEIGLELMAKIGVPPSISMSDMLAFLKLYPDDQFGGIGYAECSAMREAGFRDADGKLVSPPVGDPSNVHHNSCFRVFNMQREINAHRYSLGTRATPPGEAWSSLITRLGVEVETPAPPPPPPVADAGTD